MNQTVVALIHKGEGNYGISFPDFPGCVAAGSSIEEAIDRGRSLLAFHVEGLAEDQEEFRIRTLEELEQDPHYREDVQGALLAVVPVDLPGKAVRINVSIEERLLDQIDRAASALGQSRSAFLAEAAKQRIRGAV